MLSSLASWASWIPMLVAPSPSRPSLTSCPLKRQTQTPPTRSSPRSRSWLVIRWVFSVWREIPRAGTVHLMSQWTGTWTLLSVCLSELHHSWGTQEGAPPRPGGVLHRPHGALHRARCCPRRPRLHVLLHRPVWREWLVEWRATRRAGWGVGGVGVKLEKIRRVFLHVEKVLEIRCEQEFEWRLWGAPVCRFRKYPSLLIDR